MQYLEAWIQIMKIVLGQRFLTQLFKDLFADISSIPVILCVDQANLPVGFQHKWMSLMYIQWDLTYIAIIPPVFV